MEKNSYSTVRDEISLEAYTEKKKQEMFASIAKDLAEKEEFVKIELAEKEKELREDDKTDSTGQPLDSSKTNSRDQEERDQKANATDNRNSRYNNTNTSGEMYSNSSSTSRAPFSQGVPPQRRMPPPVRSSRGSIKSPVSLQTVATVVTILFFGLSLYILAKTTMKEDEKPLSDKQYEKDFEKLALEFKRITPNKCKQGMYYGLEDEFNGYTSRVLPYILAKDDAEWNARNRDGRETGLAKNIMVYGMPGTGKSFFARKIFLQIALNLQAEKLREKYMMKTLNFSRQQGVHSLIKELYQCNDTIEMYQIDPSMFLNSLVGSSEKLLTKFMNFMDWRQKIVPVLIFLDEGEAAFGTRTASRGGADGIDSNLKNRWLTWLEGIDTDSNKRIFMIVATNYYDRIDKAIKRRFGSFLGIPMPNRDERFETFKKELFDRNFVSTPADDEEKEKLLDSTEGFSSNLIQTVIVTLQVKWRKNKKNLPLRDLMNEVKKKKVEVDKEEKERQEQIEHKKKMGIRESDISDPKEKETSITWDPILQPIPITKQTMMEFESKFHELTDKHIEDQEKLGKIYGYLGSPDVNEQQYNSDSMTTQEINASDAKKHEEEEEEKKEKKNIGFFARILALLPKPKKN